MEIILSIPDYNPEKGIKLNWQGAFEIAVKIEEKSVVITANREGLLSLANHFANLAQREVPSGSHLRLVAFNSLEEGSAQLIISKKK